MENIKDYILKTEVEEINAAVPAPAPKAKPKVSYETVFASGPCSRSSFSASAGCK